MLFFLVTSKAQNTIVLQVIPIKLNLFEDSIDYQIVKNIMCSRSIVVQWRVIQKDNQKLACWLIWKGQTSIGYYWMMWRCKILFIICTKGFNMCKSF